MKKEIEILRLKTLMAECSKQASLPYPNQREFAKTKINSLQEEYKSLTGEYCMEFLSEEYRTDKEFDSDNPEDRELMELASKIGLNPKFRQHWTYAIRNSKNRTSNFAIVPNLGVELVLGIFGEVFDNGYEITKKK